MRRENGFEQVPEPQDTEIPAPKFSQRLKENIQQLLAKNQMLSSFRKELQYRNRQIFQGLVAAAGLIGAFNLGFIVNNNLQDLVRYRLEHQPPPACGDFPEICFRIDSDNREVLYWNPLRREGYNLRPNYNIYVESAISEDSLKPDAWSKKELIGSNIPDASISELRVVSNPRVKTLIDPSSYTGAAEKKVPWFITLDYLKMHKITIEAKLSDDDAPGISSKPILFYWNPGRAVFVPLSPR